MIKYHYSMFGILPDGFEEYIKEFINEVKRRNVDIGISSWSGGW